MKDSFNYAGFSNVLYVSRGRRKSKQSRTGVTHVDESVLSEDYRIRHYPPYLWQDLPTKPQYEK